MNLGGGLDEVLQVCAGEEVAEVHKLAVVLVLDVDDSPSVLAAAHWLAVDNDIALGSDNGEWKHVTHTLVELKLLGVELVAVEGVQADLVVLELGHDAPLKDLALLECQRVRLGNDGDDVDNLGKLLEDKDVDLTLAQPSWSLLTGLRVWPVGLMKKTQQWIRVSGMKRSRMAVSSLRRYAECWSLMYLTIGSQQPSLLTRSP